jgi:lipopolysaccharide/colanic/teichoic acid biosynthesis glycosyltransferase
MQIENKLDTKKYNSHYANYGLYLKYVKRNIDIILSLCSIIILSPVLLLVFILVRYKLGSPVIFKQYRPGLNENIFKMYKFRTMTDAKDNDGNLLSDDFRLTKFGKILRSTSLDELPELFNILKGDMSIIGPRPQLVKDLVFMTAKQRLRQTVKPGLSGWAQVNGRNRVSWEEKFELDLEYINNVTFIKDFKIILMTICKVFKRENINTDGMGTSEDLGEYLLRVGRISREEYSAGLIESHKITMGK